MVSITSNLCPRFFDGSEAATFKKELEEITKGWGKDIKDIKFKKFQRDTQDAKKLIGYTSGRF